jgi:hypothetical protein
MRKATQPSKQAKAKEEKKNQQEPGVDKATPSNPPKQSYREKMLSKKSGRRLTAGKR